MDYDVEMMKGVKVSCGTLTDILQPTVLILTLNLHPHPHPHPLTLTTFTTLG